MFYEFTHLATGSVTRVFEENRYGSLERAQKSLTGHPSEYGLSITHEDPTTTTLINNKRVINEALPA